MKRIQTRRWPAGCDDPAGVSSWFNQGVAGIDGWNFSTFALERLAE